MLNLKLAPSIQNTLQDVSSLLRLIDQKEEEIRNLLQENKVTSPSKLSYKAYKTFKKSREEILSALVILEKLGHQEKKKNIRFNFRHGPFFSFQEHDFTSPESKKQITQLGEDQDKVLESMEINVEEMREIRFPNIYPTIKRYL